MQAAAAELDRLEAERAAAEAAEQARKDAAALAAAATAQAALASVDQETLRKLGFVRAADIDAMLDARGYKAKRRLRPSDEIDLSVPEGEYHSEETERFVADVQALLELKGGQTGVCAVFVRDIIEHIAPLKGGKFTPSNVRYHMQKMATAKLVYQGMLKRATSGGALSYFWAATPEDAVKVWKGRTAAGTRAH